MTNFSLPENLTSMSQIFSYTNNLTDGSLGITIVMAVFVVAFVSVRFSGNELSRSLVGAMAITTFISIFLRILNLLSDVFFIPMIILTALGVLVIYFQD